MADHNIAVVDTIGVQDRPSMDGLLERLPIVGDDYNVWGDIFKKYIQKGQGWVDVRAFGAIGDGVADDTATIQAAIDSFGQAVGQSASGGQVFFPSGEYKITSTINVYSGIHIVGAGTQATIIKCNSVGSGYAFKNVDNANFFSYHGLTINGGGTTTCKGGIFIGNNSGGGGFSAYISVKDIDIQAFTTTAAIGINLANPSHCHLSNVNIFALADGSGGATALIIVANMTNAGVFSFDACKFGDWIGTDNGLEIQSSSSSSASVSEVIFNGCFFGGTIRSVRLKVPSAPAGNHRNIKFNSCHCETNNTDADSDLMLIEACINLSINNCGLHGGGNTDNGILFNKGGVVGGVSLVNNAFINLDTNGDAVEISSSGGGSFNNIEIQGIFLKDTTPTKVNDTVGVARVDFGPEIPTLTNSDTTPSLQGSRVFATNTSGVTITRFDDGYVGQEVTLISKGAIVFDTSTATRLIGSSVDITTASGDITTWVCEVGGTTSSIWRLKGFVDVSEDNSAGA
jgi:polygalacturonase